MKITTQQLKQIIKEEKAKIIKEQRGGRREALGMLEEFEAKKGARVTNLERQTLTPYLTLSTSKIYHS